MTTQNKVLVSNTKYTSFSSDVLSPSVNCLFFQVNSPCFAALSAPLCINNYPQPYHWLLDMEPEKSTHKTERFTETLTPCWLGFYCCLQWRPWRTVSISHVVMCFADCCYRADHKKKCLTYVWCSGLFQVQQPILNSTADPHTHVACRSKNIISISTMQCVSSMLHFR